MTLNDSDYHHTCSPQNRSPFCGSRVPRELSILPSGQTEATSTNPEIQRESELPGPCKPQALDITWMHSKRNTHGFVPSDIKRAKAICHFTQNPQGSAGERSTGRVRQGGQEAEGQRQPGTRALLTWPSLCPRFCGLFS